MTDPDLRITGVGQGGGEERGGRGGHLDPEIREGAGLEKFLFLRLV